jgi:uncharacterized protein
MNREIIDFHTHAFPDALAERAVRTLEGKGDVTARLDGTIGGLLRSMDANGIERSLVCSIATKPAQFEPILSWSASIRSPRIIPLPSVHPDDPAATEHIRHIRKAGFCGIKLHPFYQDFFLDEPRLFPLYRSIAEERLILVVHTGFDLAFTRIPRGTPERIRAVQEAFPDLLLVATHLGAWQEWAAVEQHLLGRKIYTELSFSLEYLPHAEARRMILAHPPEHLLFGSDSPWADQGEAAALVRGLELDAARERMLFRENARRLLEQAGWTP